MQMYTAQDWGDKAYCIAGGRDGDKIESVPIIRRGRIYMILGRNSRFKIADGKSEDRYYGGQYQYYPTEQLAYIALRRRHIMCELKPLFNYTGDRRLEELDLKSLEDLYTILLTPFETWE